MKLVTAAEMRALEAQAGAAGTPEPVLMDRAARAVAAEVDRALGGAGGQRILLLVGPGNNGGDGLWAAVYLRERGAVVCCYCWGRANLAQPDPTQDAPAAAAAQAGIPLLDAADDPDQARLGRLLRDAAAVVDALLGLGLTRPISGDLLALISLVRRGLDWRRGQSRPLPVFAVDLPTGVDGDSGRIWGVALPATMTVTFGFAKRGLYQYPGAALAGPIHIADIGVGGLDSEIKTTLTDAAQVRGLLPARPDDANKGTFGRLLIVAGSVNYIGAGVLATLGALRSGVGLATLAVPGELLPIMAAKLTEATFVALPSDMGVLIDRSVERITKTLDEREYDALLVGPGLGQEKETGAFLRSLLLAGDGVGGRGERAVGFAARRLAESTHAAERSGGGSVGFAARRPVESAPAAPAKEEKTHRALPPLVLDADALNLLAEIEGGIGKLPPGGVLTPHPGEMARLRGLTIDEVQADRPGLAALAAQEWNQVVVLKGAKTVIAAPDGRVQINPAATSALASGGTGDVLAGAIASLIAQGVAPFEAAVAGVWLHGRAGELAAAQIGPAGVLASEIAGLLPAAWRDALGG